MKNYSVISDIKDLVTKNYVDGASITGNAGTATILQTARTINGVSFNGSGNITIPAAAGTLTGTSLAAGVTASSLTSVGTLGSLTMGGAITGVTDLTTTGNTILGNAQADTLNVGNGDIIKDASGNVGIGVTPGAYKLNVNGTVRLSSIERTTAGQLYINASDAAGYVTVNTAGFERMRVDSSGNVGIGITPTVKFHVSSAGSHLFTFNSTSATGGYGGFARGSTFYGYLGNGPDLIAGGTLDHFAIRAENSLVISTGGLTERLRIDSSGNVGIGSTPVAKLGVVTTNPGVYSSNAAWNSGYFVVSPNAGNANGASVGLGYDTTNDIGNIFSLAPGVAWKPLNLNANEFRFNCASAERMRIDSTGNVGIGRTASSTVILDIKEPDAATDLILGLSAGTGGRAQIRSIAQADGTTSELSFYTATGGNNTERLRISTVGHTTPGVDNTQTLGSASFRWSTVYAGTGTINTSDRNLKTDIRDVSDLELKVAKELKKLIKAFRYIGAIETKGSANARIHFGVIAQDVEKVFRDNGLDASRYGLFCRDIIQEDGKQVSRLGVRYEELLVFLMTAG